MKSGAVVAVAIGTLFALIGLSTIVGTLVDAELNSNGVLAGVLGGIPFLVFGGGLVLFGFGLHRRWVSASDGETDKGSTEGRKMIVGGAFLAIASVLGLAAIIGLLLLFTEAIRQTT